jgi:lysylphosphatidylglycerol synthetase-like protein (DUF2156 family)
MRPIRKMLIYLGGVLTIIWGIAHIFPLYNVVMGFGNISLDNIRIIQMEWLTEAFSLIFIGLLIIVITTIGDQESKAVKSVYILTFIMLIALSVLSLFTGFKIDFIPYKLCPLIFTTSGLLILQGAFTGDTKN